MSDAGRKKFGWFALIFAFLIGYSLGESDTKNKAQIEIRQLNDEVTEKDSEIGKLKSSKIVCSEDEVNK